MNSELKRIPTPERLRAVADLYTSGLNVAETAAETGLSERTVKQYLNCANISIDEKKWIDGGEAAEQWAKKWNKERRKWIK